MKSISIYKKEIISGSKAAGLNIWINQDDEFEITLVVIKTSGKKVSIIEKRSLTSIIDLKKSISGNIPLYLSIDGKGILHKIIDLQSGGSIIDLVLPNADRNDFAIQDLNLAEKKKIISIIRQKKLDDIVFKINEEGYDILKIFLGPFSIISISKFLESTSTLHLPYYKLCLKDHLILGFEKDPEPKPEFSFEIESGTIPSTFIIPFSTSLYHFVKACPVNLDYSDIEHQKENFKFKRLFKMGGLSILGFLFFSLLLNYIIFERFRQKSQVLLIQIGSNKEILNKIESLKNQIKIRENLFNRIPLSENLPFAYYSDRMAREIPESVILRNLTLFPTQKNFKNVEEFHFLSDRILISGYSYYSDKIDQYIKSLKDFNWINDILIKNYTDDGNDPARFDLELVVKNPQK